MGEIDSIADDGLRVFIEKAKASGGAERANYQIFIQGLCANLGLPKPEFTDEREARNDYVFDRRVTFKSGRETEAPGWIDCYKRGCFILEVKQSAKRQGKKPNADQLALLPQEATQFKLGHARRGGGGWDPVMRAAVFDLVWPDGLQAGLSEPIAMLLNEVEDVLAVASAAGFRCFRSETEFRDWVHREIIADAA